MRIIGVLLLVSCMLFSACSALRFGYNQAPEAAYWWLDGFVDFNEDQAVSARIALAHWFDWHRATQLADYAALLAQVQVQAGEATTPAAACALMDGLTARLDAAYQHAVPWLADFVLTMSPAQLKNLERRYAKNNADYRNEYLRSPAAERSKASIKRAVDWAESFYGRLEEPQREHIAKAVVQSPFDPQASLEERKARQQDILATLRPSIGAGPDAAGKLRAQLRALPERFVRSPRSEYRAYSERLTQYNCAFAADIHNLTTPAQRQFAIRKLKGWESDLRALSVDAR